MLIELDNGIDYGFVSGGLNEASHEERRIPMSEQILNQDDRPKEIPSLTISHILLINNAGFVYLRKGGEDEI